MWKWEFSYILGHNLCTRHIDIRTHVRIPAYPQCIGHNSIPIFLNGIVAVSLSTHLFWLLEAKTHFLRAKMKVRRLVMFQNVLSQKSSILKCKELSQNVRGRFEELLQMQKHFWSILPLEMQEMTQITLILLTTKYIENWRQTQKIREITWEDQGEEVHGCGLREVLKIFGEIQRNYLWRSRWRSVWVWAVCGWS